MSTTSESKINQFQSVAQGIEAIKNGKMIILMDDEDRENEGDLVLAAEYATPEAINFMVTHARGLVCLALERTRIEALDLPLMSQRNRSGQNTAFTMSIEAKTGVTTGISASDRAHTIRTAIDPSCGAEDIVTPGHIFPLKAVDGGVLVRAGHTEGSVDLARLAGLKAGAVICEIMKTDGSMARKEDLFEFAKAHGDIPILTIKDLISYRMKHETLISEVARSKLPTKHGDFQLIAFRNHVDQTEHMALSLEKNKQITPLVRVHSECLTGDSFGSLRCDCGDQLDTALKMIQAHGNGVLVYMRNHEGRGIGLANKVKAYHLQDHGLDTVEANHKLGFPADLRHYGIGAQMLKHLGVSEMDLMTNNPKKIVGLDGYGLKIRHQIPLEIEPNQHSSKYLLTKKEKLSHRLSIVDEHTQKSSAHENCNHP